MNRKVYTVHLMNNDHREESLTLEILESIENRSDITQRHLADDLGVALGLTNSYLKRCVRKGYVKIKQIPANRYLYYLTPKGFTEKSRLTAKFLSSSFDVYRKASRDYGILMEQCQREGNDRILLCGISELAEIASIRALENGINVLGIYGADTYKKTLIGVPVYQDITGIPGADYLVLTELNDPREMYLYLRKHSVSKNLLVPGFLSYVEQKQE